MKSALTYLIAGVVSTLVTLPAWAQDSSNYLVAPPLLVAGDGPVTLTFQGVRTASRVSLPGRRFPPAPACGQMGRRSRFPVVK